MPEELSELDFETFKESIVVRLLGRLSTIERAIRKPSDQEACDEIAGDLIRFFRSDERMTRFLSEFFDVLTEFLYERIVALYREGDAITFWGSKTKAEMTSLLGFPVEGDIQSNMKVGIQKDQEKAEDLGKKIVGQIIKKLL